MKKCLILLTNITPLKKSEAFVKNEIPFLSDTFDKVLVLALQKTQGELIENSFADNVDIYEISDANEKNEKLKSKISGVFGLLKPNNIMKSEFKFIGTDLKKALFLSYFENRCSVKFKQCLSVLEKYDFSKYQEVVVYSYWFFLTCRVGIEIKNYLKSKGVKISIITRAHRYDLYEYVNTLNYLPEREFLAENVDYVFPCSVNGERHLKDKLPEYKYKIKHKYLGTYDYGLADYTQTFHIVSCSRVTSIKRIDKLIEALSNLKDKNLEIYWTHIGDGDLFKKIKALANEKLNFMDFEFLGSMDNADILRYYSTHPVNLFVNVSDSEGLPVSIMEATSFGIPVLATDVGGTNEIVKNSFNGLLLNKDFTDQEFCEALIKIYTMKKSEYEILRNNARSFWEDNFNAQINYTEFSHILADLEPIV